MKRFIAILIGFTMIFGILTACGSDGSGSETANETSCDVFVDESAIADLIQIENIEVPVGSTADDIMKAVEVDSDKVNYVSFDLNFIDLDVPGKYTVRVTVNIPNDNAAAYVDSEDIDSDADTVNLITEFNITVTGAETSDTSDNADVGETSEAA